MLAVLEHKPWAPEEGEEWIAAFSWTGERAKLDEAELTVSPDLAVQLPLPDGPGDSGAKPASPEAAERRTAGGRGPPCWRTSSPRRWRR